VIYEVKEDRCILQTHDGLLFLEMLDYNCDNTVDYINPNSILNRKDRKYLLEGGKAEELDSLLERIQEEIVRPENKV
ncbi:MAG: hypothetical protein KKH52_00770, partial [Nanoarchaeota archaeon]|nr:hypothetical protein [Nanoarchaeota archaeon]